MRVVTPVPPPGPLRRSRRRRAARSAGFALLALLVLLAFMAGTAWRLTRSGIALPDWAVTRIEARLDRDLPDVPLALGGIALGYDLEAQSLRLLLRGVAIERDGAEIVRLPRAVVALSGPALLRGRLRPQTIRASGLALEAARDAAGRWSLALGRGDDPRGWASLDALDRLLAIPALGSLREVRLEDVRVRVSDAASGLAQDLIQGEARLARDGDALALDASVAVPYPGGAARLTAAATRDAGGTRATVDLGALPIGALAAALPRIPALTLATGRIAARGAFAIGPTGRPGPLRGTVEVTGARLTDRPRLRADRIALGFAWRPGDARVALTEVALSAPDARLAATGQVIFEAGLSGPVQAQLRLSAVELDPDGVFARRVAFEDGVIEARLTQAPLALRLGQGMLTGPSGTARASGRALFTPAGIEGALDLAVPRMAVGDLAALWPTDLAPGARRWFTTNLVDGVARDVTVALRVAPDRAPLLAGSLRFEEAVVRYMRTLPPARGARGALDYLDGRLAIRVDRASVPARGPTGVPEGAERIDIDGTTVLLPDALHRPPHAQVDLRARGAVGDVLAVLDNPPFRLLDRLGRDRDLASGRMTAAVTVALPLRRGNAPADIAWSVDGTLEDVRSERLVPGRTIAAERLHLVASAEAVAVDGAATLDGVPFTGRWRQPLPPPATSPLSQGDAPRPGPPLPPAVVSGRATVTPGGLAALGVAFDALRVSGKTEAAVSVTLPPGGPATLAVESDLVGLAAALPAIGWRKAADRRAALALAVELGAAPRITALRLDAPRLALEGTGRLAAGGGLDVLTLSRVAAGWFEGPVTITGRGPGAAPAIAVRGGRADLRAAPFGRGASEGSGGAAPVRVALDRLQVTEGIALSDLRARIDGGGRGTFTGRANGAVPVEGALAPRGGGTAVTVRAADAGALLRALDLYRTARGGRLEMTLQPAGGAGRYDGSLRGAGIVATRAPALAELLQAISAGGTAGGVRFDTFGARLSARARPDRPAPRGGGRTRPFDHRRRHDRPGGGTGGDRRGRLAVPRAGGAGLRAER